MTNPIPTDWKQTKLGKIPLEWWNGKIQDLVDEKIIEKPIDGNHGNIHPKSSDFVESGIPFVMANDIVNEHLCLEKTSKIKKEQANNLQKGFSYAGDVLFTHKGSVGNTAIVPELETDYIMLTPQVTYYRVKDQKKLDPIFLRKLFQSTRFQSLLESLSGGGTRAYIGITAQRELPFYCPKIIEQHRIVSVLETWDKALEYLTRKIQLKKNIKKGLMQELLTGKRRLKGFSGEWPLVKIGEFLKEIVNKTTQNDQFPVLTSSRRGIFLQSEYFNKQVASKDNIGYKILKNGEFTYRAMTDDGKFVFNRLDKLDIGIVSPAYAVFEPKGINSDYLLCILNTRRFGYEALKYAQGGTRQSLKFKSLSEVEIRIPNIEEQNAIAQILITADDEIALLQKKKQILEDQKKYLLNNLITGKIRTPENLTMNNHAS